MGLFSALIGGVVGFFIGGPAGAVIGAGLGATKVGEKVVNTVLDFVTQPFMPDVPSVDSGEAERQQGVLVQTSGSTVSIPVVYGYRKVGGTVVFAETGASNNKYLYVAYVFSEGLVEGLREVYINDWLLPTDQVGALNAGQLVTVNADRYKDRVQMRWYPGVYYTNPRSSTVGSTVKGDIFAEAPSFVKEMNFNGLAVLFARYEWKDIKTQADADANPFTGSIPEIQVAMLGKRVASLLVDTTQTTAYDANLVRYSTNPAEILLDYLRNPRYGKGLTNDDINWVVWKNAARKCNQTVTYIASGITGPILTLNTVVDTSQTLMSNTKTLLQNFRGYMPYVQGKYKLMIEDAGNTYDILSGSALIVGTFTKDDIVSDITFSGIDRSSKYNVVSVTYVDPDQKFSNQTVVYPETEAERQIYIDKDGGRENKYDVTLGGITNYAIAKDFARLIFNKQRYQESAVFTATSKALELEPGDCIRIQSNLLNFGTDPWRVVSVRINGDMTVDLGCVRNPDFIYPYVRVGEEDYVVPPYIPKGSIIYFPSSDNRVPLGLVPPMFAVFPPDTVPVMSNPVATNPDLLGGGGVGGGSNGGTTAGPVESTTTTPTPTTNTTPTPAPVVPPFSAVLTLKSTKATIQSNNTSIFTLTFTQPSDGLYDHATFWWRLNQYSAWTEITVTTKPGSGGEIPVTITGLPGTGVNQYQFYIRAFATDGRGSNFVSNGVFGLKQDQTTGLFVGAGSAQTTQITDGWTVPSSTVVSNPVYDDDIEFIAIKTKLSAGSPQDPRRLTVDIEQLQNFITKAPNSLIGGFTVYYRFKGDTYWSYEKFEYPANYTGIGRLSYDLAGDFGAAGQLGSLQQYEFLVRLNYKNGTAALKQMGPTAAPVEVNGLGATSYTVFGTDAYAAAPSQKSVSIPATFNLQTVDQAPQTAPAGADIVPVVRIIADPTVSKLTFRFTPPTGTSKFRGYRIRYREVVPGANIEFITVEVAGTATAADGSIDKIVQAMTYVHGRKYEWSITALYSLNGTPTEGTYSLYGKAMIPFSTYDYDLYAKMFPAPQPVETVTALGNLRASFPALPTINPKSWIKKQVSVANTSQGVYTDVSKSSSTNYYLNSYYQLKFQPDSTSDSVVIYRRVWNSIGAARTAATTTSAKYLGLGGWDKQVVALSSLTTDADGWKVLNVRGPVHNSIFEQYYEISAGKTLYKNIWGPAPSKYPYQGSTFFATDVYPYYGVGNNPVTSTTTEWCEYMFVLASSGTEATKGLLLRDFQTTTTGTGFTSEVDGFISGNVAKDTIVNVADYNGFTNGYKRNINEAITVSLAALHWQPGTIGNSAPFPGQTGVPNAPNYTSDYSIFLQNPTTGVTVY